MNVQEAREVYLANPEVAKQAEEKLQALLSRSSTDMEFRQRLLAEPRAALAEFMGRDVPDGFDLVFVENKAGTTIVLPDAVDPNAELSETELEAVAGGATPAIASVLSIIATIGYIFTD